MNKLKRKRVSLGSGDAFYCYEFRRREKILLRQIVVNYDTITNYDSLLLGSDFKLSRNTFQQWTVAFGRLLIWRN